MSIYVIAIVTCVIIIHNFVRYGRVINHTSKSRIGQLQLYIVESMLKLRESQMFDHFICDVFQHDYG